MLNQVHVKYVETTVSKNFLPSSAKPKPQLSLSLIAKLRQSSDYSWPELSLIFSVSHLPTTRPGKSFQDILADLEKVVIHPQAENSEFYNVLKIA